MALQETQVFLIHAEGDDRFKEKLVTQARSGSMEVEFQNMPTKMPWVPHWKATCRNRIYESDAAILLVSSKVPKAANLTTELDFVNEFHTPVLAIYMDSYRGALPVQAKGWRVIEWNWDEIARFIRTPGGQTASAAGSPPGV